MTLLLCCLAVSATPPRAPEPPPVERPYLPFYVSTRRSLWFP